MLSFFKQSFIFPFKTVNFFNASSISFESVMNKMSEDDDPADVNVAVDGVLFLLLLLLPIADDETAKLEHNLLNPTSFESISFSSCLACFLKT
jgi:hypothetical protein